MNLKTHCLTAILMVFAGSLCAKTTDKEVVISECSDVYTFMQADDGTVTVRNKVVTDYRSLTDRPLNIQSYTLYGDFISLDASSGKGAAQYRNATPENVFYDDTKVCYYYLSFDRKNRTARTKFERTFKDIRYFTRVYLSDEHPIEHKTVVFRIPKQLTGFQLVPRNLTPAVSFTQSEEEGYLIYTFTLSGQEAMVEEEHMPSMASVYPCVLIKGAFSDYQDLYRWSHGLTLIDRDIPQLQSILGEIGAHATTPTDRIRATYEWVQQHIRYVAFEAGITGHQPDRPAEVVRKCYGDCKGMAMLLYTLLKAQQFDARLVDIGTHDIPFGIGEMPTLAAANHMICTLRHDGRTYWLDATNRYIPITHVPGNLQGREALVENGDEGILQTLPIMPPNASTDSLHYTYQLEMGADQVPMLTGTVSDSWCGDMKEMIMNSYEHVPQQDKPLFMSNTINDDTHSATITQTTWTSNDRKATWARLEGHIANNSKIQTLDGEMYVELNPNNEMFGLSIDTTDRHHDYMLPMRCRIVRQVDLVVPTGYHVVLPASATFACNQATMECGFAQRGDTVTFRRVLTINDRHIPREQLDHWNDCIRQWNDACNEQLIISKH